MKSQIKEPDGDLLGVIQNYFECSNEDAKTYLQLLPLEDKTNILKELGISEKEPVFKLLIKNKK
jgi:hypothetical protein